MKFTLLIFTLFSYINCDSQNIFPSSGNVGIGITTPTAPLQINSSANEIINIIGSGPLRGGMYVQNTNSAGHANVLIENNRGSFTSYGGFTVGGTTNAYPNIFGLSRQDRTFLFADGTYSLGLSIGTLTAQPLVFGTNNTEQMRLDASGNLCIGITSGVEKLTISGNALANKFRLNNLSTPVSGAGIFAPAASTFAVYTNSSEQMRVDANGHVGIGTININDVNYRLFVETGIRTRMIKVDQTAWPDFVFDPSYPLLPLNELKFYIDSNKHLPGIATADEVEKDGVDLGANQAILLKKVEELTLYIIEQEKKMAAMQLKMDELNENFKLLIGKK